MKQKLLLTYTALLLLAQTTNAQEAARLTVPSSPAFSILNFEPSAVMRPVNARDLAADVLNSFDGDGKLRLNLGLEVMPYWLSSHPTLTRSKYLRPSTGQTFLQSLSISAATVKDSATGNNRLGAGFRFKLANGRPVPELEVANTELKARTTVVSIINGVKNVVGPVINTRTLAAQNVLTALASANTSQQLIAAVQKDTAELISNYTDSPSDIKLFLDELIRRRVESYGQLAERVSALLYQRKGFILEFAGAAGYNTTNATSLDKTGVWGNASYFVSPDDLFTLTARFMNRSGDSSLRNADVGIGFLKKTERYNISLEGMLRWYRAEVVDRSTVSPPVARLEKEFTYRLAVQSSYIFNDYLSINLNLGKDFNSPFIAGKGFFSIFGFNYSFFSRKPAELKE
ncbi:MAG TPA: hypothetical protein VMR70_13900 [Flavisolibacter sp.]|nr:hypothetical protein [Flavisolibacter sp.]